MAEIIKIQIDLETYLDGAYSRPTEDSIAALDTLLVIMVHGFPGDKHAHGHLFHDLEFLLRDKGYHTLRFDLRGCGESDGRQEDFTLAGAQEDMQAVYEWAQAQGYERFMLVGEGLGASVCILSADARTRGLCLLWPMLDLPLIARGTFHAGDMKPEWLKAGYMLKDHHRIGVPLLTELLKADLSPALAAIDAPILVMHGAMDTISPPEQLDFLRARTTSRRVEITSFQDGEHGLPSINHRKALYYHMGEFIARYT